VHGVIVEKDKLRPAGEQRTNIRSEGLEKNIGLVKQTPKVDGRDQIPKNFPVAMRKITIVGGRKDKGPGLRIKKYRTCETGKYIPDTQAKEKRKARQSRESVFRSGEDPEGRGNRRAII